MPKSLAPLLFVAVLAASTGSLSAAEIRNVGPFQLVFHEKGEIYGGETGSRDWDQGQIEAVERAAQSWVDRLGNRPADGSIPLHLIQADLGSADPTTGSVILGASSNPLGPTTPGHVGTREEQVWRNHQGAGLAGPGCIYINTNATVVRSDDDNSASLTKGGRFQQLIAHEIGHSMGIYGNATSTVPPYTVYDDQLRDSGGHAPGPDFDPTLPVTWAGDGAERVYGARVPIYSPSSFRPGSSLYHVDIRNLLMNYSASNMSATIRGASALELAMFEDMGWQLDATRFDARTFADSHSTIFNRDDLLANVTAGVALGIVNGGGSAGNLRRVAQDGDTTVGQTGSIGIGLWSSYNRLVNNGRITATGDYNAGIYAEGTGNVLVQNGFIDVTGEDALGILVVGSNNQVVNSGTIRTRLASLGNVGTAILFSGSGTGNQLALQIGAIVEGDIETGAPAGLSFGQSAATPGSGDPAFALVFSDRIIGAWDAVFWGGAAALGTRDIYAPPNEFTSVEVKPGATLTSRADMQVSGQVVVRSGARLAGTPEIRRPSGSTSTAALLDSQPGTTLMPGDVAGADAGPQKAIGTMAVAGDLASDGKVEIDLTWRPAFTVGQDSDRLAVSGGTARVNTRDRATFEFSGEAPAGPPAYGIARRYTILTTDVGGGLTIGARPEIEDGLALRRMILRTDQCLAGFSPVGQIYYAYVGRDVPMALVAATPNQRALGSYLDSINGLDDGSFGTALADLQWVRDTLDLMPEEDNVRRGLEQLGGEVYASLGAIGSQRMFLAYHRLARRLRANIFRDPCDVPEHPTIPGQNDDTVRVMSWVTGFADRGAIQSDGNAQRYDASAGGVQAGFGYDVVDQLAFGVFYEFDGVSLDDAWADDASLAMHQFGGYAAYHPGRAYVLAAGGGGIANYRATRRLLLANPWNAVGRWNHGDHFGSEWGVYGEAGANFGAGEAGFRPYLGLLYSGVHQDAFSETGGGIASLSVRETTTDALRLLLGAQLDVRLPFEVDTVWTLRGAWVHECLSETGGLVTAGFSQLPGPTFTVRGLDLGSDWGMMGTDIRAALWRNIVRIYGSYDLLVNTRQQLHTGSGGIEYVW